VPASPSPARPRAQGIQSVETGGALLEALVAGGHPMMLKDLAAAAGMPAAKAHRYLVSFIRLGLVEQDGTAGRYTLGPFALRLGLAALGRLDAVRLATPRLPELASRLGATVALAVWGNHGATIVRWEESRDIVTVNVRAGGVMPLLSSATGRCFAAWMPPGAIDPLVAEELRQAGRPGVPRDRGEADRMLQEVRRSGLARVAGQLIPGVDALAAPVFDHRGAMVLAVTVLGYAGTFDSHADGPVARALQAFADDLSDRLGALAEKSGNP
jgi:DNA-binding IclR family transcriptional regulator